MVERERREREDVLILGETSFKEMGIELPIDRLNLAGDRLTLAVVGNIRFAFDHHPFSGEHFAQFLESIAPSKGRGRSGILADLRMPLDAKRELEEQGLETSFNIRLHSRHLEDSQVGPLYKKFVDQNLDSWYTALNNDASLGVFEDLKRVTFIKSLQDFAPYVFQEWEESLKKSVSLFAVQNSAFLLSLTALKFYQEGKPFKEFLFKEFFKDKVSLPLKGDSYDRTYYYMQPERQKKLLYNFLEQLYNKEREEFVAIHLTNHEGRVLVDLNSKQVWQGRHSSFATIDLVDDRRIEIKDDDGTAFEVMPSSDIVGGRFGWKVSRYKFSPRYLSTALYPVIAWEKDENGERRFLSQDEANPYLRSLGLTKTKRGDVTLGEVMVTYFSPDTVGHWKREIPLKPPEEFKDSPQGDFEQPMMGGQMPVWVALGDHSLQLFSEKNGVISKLEARMASAL